MGRCSCQATTGEHTTNGIVGFLEFVFFVALSTSNDQRHQLMQKTGGLVLLQAEIV